MRSKFYVLFRTIFFIFIFIYCFIWAFSPFIARYYLNNNILPKPLTLLSSSSIRYNPFTSHLSVDELILQTDHADTHDVLKIERMDVELNLYQLAFDEIYISEFKIDGIYLQINVDNEAIEVAGIEISNNTASTPEAKPEAAETPFPYEIIIPEIIINNTNLDLQHFKQQHVIALQSLNIDNSRMSLANQSLSLNLKSTINDAPLAISIDTALHQQLGEVKIAITLEQLALNTFQQFLPDGIKGLTGEVSYSANHLLTLSKDRTQAIVNDLKLSLNALAVEQGNVAISVNEQAINSEMLTIAIEPSQALSVDGVMNFSGNQFVALTVDTEEQLAEIGAVSIPKMKFSLSDNMPSANIESLLINQAIFSQRANQEIPALAAFSALRIDGISATQQSLNITDMSLSGLKVDVSLDQDKVMENLVVLNSISENVVKDDPKVADTESEAVTSETTNEQVISEPEVNVAANDNSTSEVASFAFALDRFQLQDEAVINLNDKSVMPNYQRVFRLITLDVNDIDTQSNELISKAKLIGKSDQYAHFDFKATGQPFIDKKHFSVNGVLKEVSLPAVSSYIKDALEHEIISGQVDLDVDAKLTGTIIDGNIDVMLRGIEFSAADDHEANSINDKTSIPFNVALDMLKDSDGNVELSLPLSGDTSSPSFGASGFLTLLIKQATMAAAKEYLITTFIPYASVLKVALIAGEYALKLRVNDLIYQPKQTELTATQIEFMRQLSVLLAEKSDVNVKLCPVATTLDLDDVKAGDLTLPDNITLLKGLSQTRINQFKAYMVNELKVESSRLLLCTPQVDSSESAQSRIEFVI
jgi:hypothetical protein